MKAIAAMDANRVIGLNGKIPWYVPEDFKWFKEFTLGKTLVMGKTTFDGLPPLKNRNIVVLTNTISFSEDRTAYLAENKHKCKNLYIRDSQSFNYMDFPDAIVAGGSKTYSALLPLCDELYMSHIMEEHEGDTYMPNFEPHFPNSEIYREYKNFWVVRYWR